LRIDWSGLLGNEGLSLLYFLSRLSLLHHFEVWMRDHDSYFFIRRSGLHKKRVLRMDSGGGMDSFFTILILSF